MASKRYVVGRKTRIQGRDFEPGALIGTGDVSTDGTKREFDPAKGLEEVVAVGHVIPRLQDGRIVEEKAGASGGKRGQTGQQPKAGASGTSTNNGEE